MHTVRKRLLALLLTLAMVVSLFPVSAFADAGEDEGIIAPVSEDAPAEDLSPAEESRGSIAPAGEAPEALPEKPVANEVQDTIASGTCGPNLTWTMTDNSLLISGDGEMDDFDSDAPWAVYSSNIQGITLPNYLTSIGDNAFRSCSALPAIDIPSGVTRIGSSAFADCTGLSTISFNGSAPTIEADSFQNVTATAYFTPDDTWYTGGMQNYGGNITWVEFQAFPDPDPYGTCGPNLTWALDGDVLTISGEGRMDSWEPDLNPPPWDSWRDGISSVRILDGVTDIGYGAFAYFTSLTSVEIPGSVTAICEMAFKDCSLREVTLPEGLQTIYMYAFTGSRLESVTFPSRLSGLCEHVFEGCTSLKEAIFLDGPSSAQSIGEYAFSGCTALERIVLPDSVFQICSGAFAGCSSLESIHLPKSLDESRENVFSGCTALKELHFTGSLPSMLDLSYWSGTAYYPATDPSWANADLTSFGGDVTWVPEYAIIASGYCGTEAELTNLTWKLDEAGLLTISGIGDMFDFTDEIIEFDGIAPVPMAGDSADAIPSHDIINGETGPAPWDNYRSSIKEVIVETGVTGIGTNAFVSCNQITRVTIPDTVTRVGAGAFDGVYHIKHVFYAGTEDQRAQIRSGSNTGMQLLPNAVWHYGKTAADIVPMTVEPCDGVTVSADFIAVRGEKLWVEISVAPAYRLTQALVNGTAIDLETYIVGNEDTITLSFVTEDIRVPITVEECEGVSVTLLQDYAIPGEILPVELKTAPQYRLTQVLVNGTAIDLETYVVTDESSITMSFVVEERYPGHGEVTASGYCGAQGDNLGWVLYGDGTLFINGTGAMVSYYSGTEYPWADYRKKISSLIVEEGVTTIGRYAFCIDNNDTYAALSSVSLPSTLTEIQTSAFQYCGRLTAIQIPENVTRIGDWTFAYCRNLKTVDFPSRLLSIDYAAFFGCKSLGALDLPDGITVLEAYVFSECTGLKSVSLPDSLTLIRSYAFSGCSSLTELSFPGTLTQIDTDAFSGCSSLQTIHFSEGLTRICDRAFYDCSGLKGDLVLPSSLEAIDYMAFFNCSGLTGITLQEGLVFIHMSAFQDCGFSGELVLPSTLNYIGPDAFAGSSFTGDLVIPESFTYIEAGAFNNCTFTGSLSLPDTLGTIGSRAFADCGFTGELVLPSMVDSIEEAAFSGNNFTRITIRDSLTEYAGETFSGCFELREVTLPEGMTRLPEYMFNCCSSLASIVLPDSLEKIDSFAFNYCQGLQWAQLPESITEIALDAFDGCEQLRDVLYGGTEEQRGQILCGDQTGNELLTNATWHYGKTAADIVPMTVEPCEGVTVIGSIAVRGEKLPVVYEVDPLYRLLEIRVNGTAIDLETYVVTDETAITVSFVAEDLRVPITIEECPGITVSPLEKDYVMRYEKLSLVYEVDPLYRLLEIRVNGTAIDLDTYVVTDEASITVSFVTEERYSGHGAVLNSGYCGAQGDNLRWVYYEDRTLIIFGSGEMEDFEDYSLPPYPDDDAVPVIPGLNETLAAPGTARPQYATREAPWDGLRIDRLILEEGVTSVGARAFFGDTIRETDLPKSLASIAEAAFGDHQDYKGNDLYLIRFTGSAPNSGSGFYASIINLALYPKDDASWTEDFFQRSSSRITWVGYRDEATYNTVQYELNGGEGLSRQFKGHNVDLLLTSEVPTRTGYRFLGWATEADSQDVQFRPGDSYTRNEDLTLYAVWELERYTVSFDANGGEGAPEAVTKTYNQPLTLPETQPTRADDAAPSFTVTLDPAGGTVETTSLFALRTNHYSFQSWNTAPNGYGTSYAPGGSYTAEGDVTLYAQWNVITSTAPVDLPTPVRSHYAFKGWATSSSASSGIIGSYTPGSDVTLYAIWELIPDGVLTVENTEGSHGKEITVPVDLSANPGLHYLSLQVRYDSSRMDLLGVEDGSLTGWKFTHETGILQWMPSEMADSTEAGTIVALRFQLYPTAADGNTEISVSVVDAVNLAEEKLVIFGTSASVYIHSRMPGDINGDDEVSILDLVRLLKHLAEEPVLIHYQNADVTGDGEIDGADLVRLRKYLVGDPTGVLN